MVRLRCLESTNRAASISIRKAIAIAVTVPLGDPSVGRPVCRWFDPRGDRRLLRPFLASNERTLPIWWSSASTLVSSLLTHHLVANPILASFNMSEGPTHPTLCRWGFLSTANISRKNWKAVRLSGNGTVSAVASRTVANAQQFIDQCADECPMNGPTAALGSYEALIASETVDAIYIPIPTGIRKEWVIKSAEAGKHVLCEKPVANHADDAQQMIDACAANGVQFMDGVMFDHSRRLAELRKILEAEQTIGKLRRINAQFCFSSDDEFQRSNIRTDSTLEPHGCLGDVGWYCIRFILWAARLREPTHVTARTLTPLRGTDSEGDVPGEFSAELQFDDGVSATFYCSFLTENQQTILLSGDRGYITVDDFVLPFYDAEAKWAHHHHVLEIDNCRWNFRRHTAPQAIQEYPGGEPNAQEVNMMRKISDLALHGEIDPLYPELSIKTQRILDACLRSDAAGGQRIALS